jgi:hypothetical protein
LWTGYDFEFEGTDDIVDILMRFIRSEGMCRDFFTLTLEDNKALLNINGGEGAKNFLKEEIDL